MLTAIHAALPAADPEPSGVTGSVRDSRRTGSLVLLDEFDCLTYGLNLFSGVVWNVYFKLFLKFHHQLDRIKRVGSEVVDERCFGSDLILAHTELGRNDFDHSILNRCHL
jgi:hypothetical protein